MLRTKFDLYQPFTAFAHHGSKSMTRLFSFLLAAALLPAHACAQTPQQEAVPDAPIPATLFPHSDTSRFYAQGQANIIFQAHGPFHSPYESDNSLLSRGEYKTSLIGTLYLGAQLVRTPRYETEFLLDFESAGGRGISEALGLAGFTNLDVVRNPNLGSKPYIARIQMHGTIGLGGGTTEAERTPFSLATKVPTRRIDLRIGKLSLPDVLDLNSIGTDSHLQFLNWTVDNNGAWDYAADTRGYTYAAIAEYDDKIWSARYAFALMPTQPNGIDIDWNARRARGENTEFELRKGLLSAFLPSERKGTIRLLGFVNHANMGLYRDAIKNYLAGLTPTPDIDVHAERPTVKYGFGGNFEQELTSNLRAYGRFGWNEGQHESYAYTEVDQTIALGADYNMQSHGRPLDKIGLTYVTNAIKRDHQNYLKLGGKGFLLGDGNLNYAREDIVEAYYNVHTWRGVFYALDMQYITHPGYNADRGPVLVESVRMHVDF
ncbi:Carbohydrate-selective porin, OprB family [Granulicella pectinivorans]|uniref:Carbohydrate-selective porin, OprB family n=1 Tax=Granulicella pectinivorans TaxID=474950 RepID=A0A1I6MFV0_9BACT|nr:carbohydrate porin [Granulicella pectinivorans]SFS14488.1 Carbohydrate-selective porin, OprB family [Granulicella pectinivorans]